MNKIYLKAKSIKQSYMLDAEKRKFKFGDQVYINKTNEKGVVIGYVFQNSDSHGYYCLYGKDQLYRSTDLTLNDKASRLFSTFRQIKNHINYICLSKVSNVDDCQNSIPLYNCHYNNLYYPIYDSLYEVHIFYLGETVQICAPHTFYDGMVGTIVNSHNIGGCLGVSICVYNDSNLNISTMHGTTYNSTIHGTGATSNNKKIYSEIINIPIFYLKPINITPICYLKEMYTTAFKNKDTKVNSSNDNSILDTNEKLQLGTYVFMQHSYDKILSHLKAVNTTDDSLLYALSYIYNFIKYKATNSTTIKQAKVITVVDNDEGRLFVHLMEEVNKKIADTMHIVELFNFCKE